jgi:hypothetical protein
MTFWERRVDYDVVEAVSQWLGADVDPLTDLPFNIKLDELRSLGRAVEAKLNVQLPLFASDKWTTVGQIQQSARVAVLRQMRLDA